MMEQAQAQDNESQPPPPEVAPAPPDAVFDAPGMPGVRMMAPIPDRVPPPEIVPPSPDAVFDAPGMPGVRMMTPIPDRVPMPVAKPAFASANASQGGRALLQQAFAATGRDWNRARLLAAQAGDPIGRLIVEWRYVLEETSGANFETINAFLNEHPSWPRHDALMIRAEKAMPTDLDPRDVVSWYGTRSPRSGSGMIRLGEALMATGRRDEGAALIRKGWIDYNFSPFDENQIVAAHGDLIGPADQKARLDRLLARDDTVGANRQLRRVDAATQRVAAVRLKIKAGTSNATVKALVASLPDSARNDPELTFEEARALRRRGDDETAWALMASAPSNKEGLVLPERWAVERGIMARDAMKVGKRDLAYQLASAPALDADSGAAFMEAEFLAGWIALQSLHKPELALNHFDRLAKGVAYPISVARAHYWLGRTAEAMGTPADALAEYRIAAQHSATFYGQLAVAKIAANPVLHVNAVASEPSPAERAAFEADDRVKAIRLLADFSDRSTMRLFALSIASDPPEPRRLQMLAQLMGASGDPAMSVRVAKNASYSGLNLLSYLHPVMATPQMQMSGGAPEGGREQRRRPRLDAVDARFGQTRGEHARHGLSAERSDRQSVLQHAAGDDDSRRISRPVERLLCAGDCLLQCGPHECAQLGRDLWRPARPGRRSDRLDRVHSVPGDPQLRPARDRKSGGLSQPAEQHRSAAWYSGRSVPTERGGNSGGQARSDPRPR